LQGARKDKAIVRDAHAAHHRIDESLQLQAEPTRKIHATAVGCTTIHDNSHWYNFPRLKAVKVPHVAVLLANRRQWALAKSAQVSLRALPLGTP
jgi:hypothetical protein